MGKVIIYLAGIIMFIGVIIHYFVYEFSHVVYSLFLFACVLVAIIGYFIDRKKSSNSKQD